MCIRDRDNLLTANYSSATLDGVLSPNDTLARAVLTSVKAVSYTPLDVYKRQAGMCMPWGATATPPSCPA